MKTLYMSALFLCISLGFSDPGGGLAERHQILYAGFLKPGYNNHRRTIPDFGKQYPVQQNFF